MELNYDLIRNRTIGTVDYVSPNEIIILLDINAPQDTLINKGIPVSFPRINSYVLIPNESGALVGSVSWIGTEQSQYPRRKGFKDFDLVDLPFQLRKLSITPVGTLKFAELSGEVIYELERGIYNFPAVGDIAILPSSEQLTTIIENRDIGAKVFIGTSPLANDVKIYVDPNKLFGRHFAVLGNTGSGKSCSVAGIIRWSLEESIKVAKLNQKELNARFIILDPNGEYSSVFDDLGLTVNKFRVILDDIPTDEGIHQLKVPAWMWNSHEWINFSQAAPGAQRPLLLDGLIGMRAGRRAQDNLMVRFRRFVVASKRVFENWLAMPPVSMQWGDRMNCGRALNLMKQDLETYVNDFSEQSIENHDLSESIRLLIAGSESLYNAKSFAWQGTTGFNAFSETELSNIVSRLLAIENALPEDLEEESAITADLPIEFNVQELPDFIRSIAELEGGQFAQFVSMLSLRIRFLLADQRMKNVIDPTEQIDLINWLIKYIGKEGKVNDQISIIDLSLIPSDVVHIIIAVLSRLVFESIQRYKRKFQKELPTVLVLEEAHSFVRILNYEDTRYSQLCTETFERIAREGRKFGLSLLLSSQRPSELSSTVLSQCNTFLLHRIVNDRDQELVKRLVPDNIGSLLKDLPTLPTRKAILLGWATQIPNLIEMRELKREQRPFSEDPKFWEVWTGEEERIIDWKEIANEWQGKILDTDENSTSDDQEEKSPSEDEN